jgi:hypothetical protein
LIEMSDVNHINILFAIAINLMLEAEKQQIEIPKSIKDSFYKWFAKRTRIETDTPISGEASVGFDFKLISGKLKTESVIRDKIKQEFERNVSDLVAKLNEIAASIQAVSQKDVLVIIDDLDKLDLAVVRSIFSDHLKTLILPRFRIIFEVSLLALRDSSIRVELRNELDNNIVVMPAAKIFRKGGGINPDLIIQENIVKNLCKILYKRLPISIMEPGIAEQIVLKSGGLMREIMRISNRCCRICLLKIRRNPEIKELKIGQKILDEAIKNLRLDFEITLGKRDYDILLEIHKNYLPRDASDQYFLDLLNGLQILEYHNSEIWYCVHPIVKEILELKGLVL